MVIKFIARDCNVEKHKLAELGGGVRELLYKVAIKKLFYYTLHASNKAVDCLLNAA